LGEAFDDIAADVAEALAERLSRQPDIRLPVAARGASVALDMRENIA